jgi:hypothetical protein
MIDRVFILLGLSLCLPTLCAAQATDQADQQETIRALVQEVKELKSRIAVLEAKQAQQDAATARSPSPAQPPEPPPTTPYTAPTQTAETGKFGIIRGIKFQGFGAVTYKANNAIPPELGAKLGFRPGTAGNFSIDDVDLFLTSQLTSRSMVLTEISFSEQPTGEFETDVERMLFKYDQSDSLRMSFGRFHTATSYYNKVFHHGQWLQTAVDRPLVVEFSDHGGLLPSQATGASVTGAIPSGRVGLNYIAEYGTPDTIRPQVTTVDADEIAFHNGNELTGGLFLKPDSLPGLEIGGSFYHDRFSPSFADVPSGLHIGQSVISAHAVYVTPHFEFLNEGFLIQHKIEETGHTFNTPSFYSLISNKFGAHWRPYFRYQYENASTGSPVFPDIGKRHEPSGGIRFDFNDYVALKAQFDHIYRSPLPGFDQFQGQLAFRF